MFRECGYTHVHTTHRLYIYIYIWLSQYTLVSKAVLRFRYYNVSHVLARYVSSVEMCDKNEIVIYDRFVAYNLLCTQQKNELDKKPGFPFECVCKFIFFVQTNVPTFAGGAVKLRCTSYLSFLATEIFL